MVSKYSVHGHLNPNSFWASRRADIMVGRPTEERVCLMAVRKQGVKGKT